MTDIQPEDFKSVIDDDPGNHNTLLVYADLLLELGNPTHVGYRRIVEHKACPVYSVGGEDEQDRFNRGYRWCWHVVGLKDWTAEFFSGMQTNRIPYLGTYHQPVQFSGSGWQPFLFVETSRGNVYARSPSVCYDVLARVYSETWIEGDDPKTARITMPTRLIRAYNLSDMRDCALSSEIWQAPRYHADPKEKVT